MPPLPPVPGVFVVRFHLQQGTDLNSMSRLYFAYTGPAPTPTQCVALALACRNAWATYMPAYMNPEIGLALTDVQDLASSSGASGTNVTSSAGTRTGNPNAAGVAVLLNYAIARRYRGGKPRVYLPALNASDLSNEQTWNGGQLANVVTAWNAVIAAIIGAPWSGATISGHVNVSYYEGFSSYQNPVTLRWKNVNKPRSTPITDPILGVTGNVAPASQRRRNRP